jgi:hypothetical protein
LKSYLVILDCSGLAERWKQVAEIFGRTKPHRPTQGSNTQAIDDGRGHDTAAELLGTKKTKGAMKTGDNPVSKPVTMLPGYKWADNSCWLDTSLQILWMAVSAKSPSFHLRFSGIHNGMIVRELFQVLYQRNSVEYASSSDTAWVMMTLEGQKNHFRNYLFKNLGRKRPSSYLSWCVESLRFCLTIDIDKCHSSGMVRRADEDAIHPW